LAGRQKTRVREAARDVSMIIEEGIEQLPPFAALKAFEAVFTFGGIRKAATRLNLNHAVVSRHVKLLEAWLGVPLVIRVGNRLALTEPGKRFHEAISAAFTDMRRATEELVTDRKERPLRLWCVPGLSIQWLSGELANFELQHPHVRIELKPTETKANFLAQEADADIRYYWDGAELGPGGRGLRCCELARPETFAVASPAVAAQFEALRPEELVDRLPFLHEDTDLEWRMWLGLNGISAPERLKGSLCWHAHLTIAAARHGRGVALANRLLVHKDIEDGTLVRLHLPDTRPVALGTYVLVAREDRWSSQPLPAIRDFLRSRAHSFIEAPA
jgi:LysR family transcriptional regulator, glycine cleavage system transcriptional activator